jgi:hypothetical protein
MAVCITCKHSSKISIFDFLKTKINIFYHLLFENVFNFASQAAQKNRSLQFWYFVHWSYFFENVIPKMWHIASTMLHWELVLDLPTCCFSAGTKLDTTGCNWFRNWSNTAKQELILWGNVPPITVSLVPIVYSNTPTSPMAPHCIANPIMNIYTIKHTLIWNTVHNHSTFLRINFVKYTPHW